MGRMRNQKLRRKDGQSDWNFPRSQQVYRPLLSSAPGDQTLCCHLSVGDRLQIREVFPNKDLLQRKEVVVWSPILNLSNC